MQHTKTVVVPLTTRTVVEKVTCDLCGEEIKCERFSAEEVTVKHRTGESYPEVGFGTEVSVDMCGKCFDEKLVPWLAEQGVAPATKEWERDW